jgi:hypothetical protein
MGPVLLTNTHSVGIAHHAAIRWLIRHYPVSLQIGIYGPFPWWENL